MARKTKADTFPQADQVADVIDAAPAAELPTPEESAMEPRPAPILTQPAARRASIWPGLLGGCLASAVGAGAALYVVIAQPDLLGLRAESTADARIAAQDQKIEALAAALTSAKPAPLDPASIDAALDKAQAEIKSRLDTISAKIAKMDTDLAALSDRVSAQESQPKAASSATEVAAATAAVTEAAKAAAAQAEQIKAQAALTEKQAAATAALGEIRAAIESGAGFEGPVARMLDAGVKVPEALAVQVQGVPTQSELVEAFAPAAREAIALSLAEAADQGAWARMTAFLRSQTGARSLTPQEGDDPDAILSRAEAALRANDLPKALSEISTLPAAGQTRMAEWVVSAKRRLDALTALSDLAGEMQ